MSHQPLKILMTNSGRKWIGEVGHCVLLQRMLEARGHRVWIACRRKKELAKYCEAQGLRHIALRYTSRFTPTRDLSDVRRLIDLIRREKIDLIHTHRGKDHWSATVAAMITRTPIVRTRHVVTPVRQHLFNRWLYARSAQAVISVSSAAEGSFGPLVDRMKRRRVILSAVDSDVFHPSKRNENWRRAHVAPGFKGEPLWIGLIGRIQRVKGQAIFLEAATRVAKEIPEAHFLIAGRGGQSVIAAYEQYARNHGFEGRLLVEGMLPQLPEVMASLDIGVVASVGSEGSSRVTMEYMASGIPVVATRVGGIPELLKPRKGALLLGGGGNDFMNRPLSGKIDSLDEVELRTALGSLSDSTFGEVDKAELAELLNKAWGLEVHPAELERCRTLDDFQTMIALLNTTEEGIGFLVPPRNPRALSDAIIKLARSPLQRAEFAAAGREHVVEHHHPERWAESIEEVYREVLASRS